MTGVPMDDDSLGAAGAAPAAGGKDCDSVPPTAILEAVVSSTACSIYDLYSPRRRAIILLVISIASIMVPFTDTIILPALTVIAADLSANMQLVTAAVSIYLAAVGIMGLFWGPASDRFGRKAVFLVGSVAFLVTSVACALAPNIGALVAFRALQGAAVAVFVVTGQGVIADAFAPATRGTASGIYFIPLLVGPILGPLLGGILAQALGWRAVFWSLVIFGVLVGVLLLTLLPETHQYFRLLRMRKADPAAAACIAEAPSITPPSFPSPLAPLAILLEPGVAPHALLALTSFGFMFSTLTELPTGLAAPPFSLSEAAIGVVFLGDGIGGLLASPLAGMAADAAARRYPGAPAARLIPATFIAGTLTPLSLVGFGWALGHPPAGGRAANLSGLIVALFFSGVACSCYLPGIFSWISVVKQQNASGAASAIHMVMFVGAAMLIQASAAATHAIGYGIYFSILAGVQFLVAAGAGYAAWRTMRRELAASANVAGYGGNGKAVGDGAAV